MICLSVDMIEKYKIDSYYFIDISIAKVVMLIA